MSRNRILIIGGVSGGADCAARVRRLDEYADIVLFERSPYADSAETSIAGDPGENKLAASLRLLKSRFNIDVRIGHEVETIDRLHNEVTVKAPAMGERYHETYTALVLAPQALPQYPELPGIDLPGVFVLRAIPDIRLLQRWIEVRRPKSAVVAGAGVMGLEVAQELVRRGLNVTLLEQEAQVMPCLDPEMAEFVRVRLLECHVNVRLNESVTAFSLCQDGALAVRTSSTKHFTADMAVLSSKLRPQARLAAEAGLELGAKGGVKVDSQMRTSDPSIWAIGEIAEIPDGFHTESLAAALGPRATRQGRIAADAICGRPARFREPKGTAVCKAFGLTVARTGATEMMLCSGGGTDFKKIYLHPDGHPAYKTGANPMHIKVLFSARDGKLLGAQAVGENGDERVIDVISMAIQMGATVFDLEEAELCQAPRYPQCPSVKDPINLAGMIGSNLLRGDAPSSDWAHALGEPSPFILDVREPTEFAAGRMDNAINIPLDQLRQRLGELPRDCEILVCCGMGQRAYFATRMLVQRGFKAKLLPGGIRTYNRLPEDFPDSNSSFTKHSESPIAPEPVGTEVK